MKKRVETNIDKLKNQRRLNVLEQVSVKKEKILKEARYWRAHRLPRPLESVLKEKGIDIEKFIVLDYEQDSPGISTDEGIILTTEGVFYEIEADLNPEKTELIELYSFVEVSDRFEINGRKKGIGKTIGFIALEVLKELNTE